jgi:hypothetical protein
MAKKNEDRVETSILPLKYVDLVEAAPFFPNGMIQGVNGILFIGEK